MRRAFAAVLLTMTLSACVRHYTVNTTIDGKPYICKIKVDRNKGDEAQIQKCVSGQLP